MEALVTRTSEIYEPVRLILKRMMNAHKELNLRLKEYELQTQPLDDAGRWLYLIHTTRKMLHKRNSVIEQIATATDQASLDTWLQYVPFTRIVQALAATKELSSMELDQLLETLTEYDLAIADLYSRIGREVPTERLAEMFEGLASSTQKEAALRHWRLRNE